MYKEFPASSGDTARESPKLDDSRAEGAVNVETSLIGQQTDTSAFPHGLRRKPLLGARTRMVIFTLLATLSIIAHHCFYAFLDGKAVTNGPISAFSRQLHAGVGEQAFASTIGNAIALLAKACLGGAVVSAFEQFFWWQLRRQARSIQQIDAILFLHANPFDPTAWTALPAFPWLSIVAVLAASFAVVPVATPGALTVDTAAHSEQPCTVPTVNISRVRLGAFTNQDISGFTDTSPTAGAFQLVSAVLMAGDHLSPQTPNITDAGSILSSYNVSFVAISLNCSNITLTSPDLDSYLPYQPNDSHLGYGIGTATVWNTTYDPNDDHYGLYLSVARRNLDARFVSDVVNHTLDGQHAGVEMVSCAALESTYNVTVHLGSAGSGARAVLAAPPIPLSGFSTGDWGSEEGTQYFSVYDAVARTLNGTVGVSYGSNTTSVTKSSNSLVAYSSLALGTLPGDNAWAWRTDLLHGLPSLMQNISISFLSGQLTTTDNSTALVDTNTTCIFSGVRFRYNRARLVWTYVAAEACTLGAVLLGFLVVLRNDGVSESLAFSRIAGAGMTLREQRADARDAEDLVTLQTRVQVDRPYGGLIPEVDRVERD